MAQQLIKFGSLADGKDGDTVRGAFDKVNANDTELYASVAVAQSALAQAIAAANAAQASADAAGAIANIAVLLDGLDDYIINGNFDIWQRGTSVASFSSANRFCADRFISTAGTSSMSISRQAFTPGQTDVPGGPTYFQRYVISSVAGANAYAITSQYIEGIERFSGKTVTLRFRMRADASRPVGLELQLNYGAGGSAAVLGAVTTSRQLSANWQLIEWTFTVPTTAGKIIGADGGSVGIVWWFDCGSLNQSRGTIGQQSGTFDLAQVSLKPAGSSAAFKVRPRALELMLCQRYYEKSYQQENAPGSTDPANRTIAYVVISGATVGGASAYVNYKVAKRVAPTLTFYSGGTGASGVVYDASSGADIAIAIINGGTMGFLMVAAPKTTNSTANIQFHWTSEAEI